MNLQENIQRIREMMGVINEEQRKPSEEELPIDVQEDISWVPSPQTYEKIKSNFDQNKD